MNNQIFNTSVKGDGSYDENMSFVCKSKRFKVT